MPKRVRDQRPPESPGTEGEQEPEVGGEGGAPEPEPEGEREPAGPQLVKITYAGKEYEVPEELKGAWEDRERVYQEGIRQKGEELGGVRREVAELRGVVTGLTKAEPKKEDEKPDPEPAFDYAKYEQLQLENPTEALKLSHQYQRDRDSWLLRQNQREQAKLRDEYTKDQATREQKSQWDRRLDQFYRENQDLEKDEDLVQLTYQRLLETDPKVQDLVRQRNFTEVFKIVADETRKRLLGYAGRKAEPPKPTGQGGRVAVAEAGGGTTSGGRAKAGEEGDDGSPKTVSEAIRAKQKSHQGAHRTRPDAARRARTE